MIAFSYQDKIMSPKAKKKKNPENFSLQWCTLIERYLFGRLLQIFIDLHFTSSFFLIYHKNPECFTLSTRVVCVIGCYATAIS